MSPRTRSTSRAQTEEPLGATALDRHSPVFTVDLYAPEMARATDDRTRHPDALTHFLLGTDDGCKLFVNGKAVFGHARHESAAPERDQVRVRLKKGRNAVLLKINNGDGPHGFYFTVQAEQELKLAAK